MSRLTDESFRLRRIARRLGWRPPMLRAQAPDRPVGAKLELTHSCNLRCGFCYTDSPRHTLARTPDLSDEQWVAIADQAADLGVIEVVLTGGEPFLRRELTLKLLRRLERRGVGLTLNTNGWFVDDALADRLAAIDGLQVDISIDGATPTLHDTARGVPGSWRRAVQAVSRLLDRGVFIQVVHVVTPENESSFPAFLEQMSTLGVVSVRATPVVEIGAAARGGRWAVDRRALRRAIKRFRSAHEATRVVLQGGAASVLAIHDEAAPAALLVRPSGAVLTDSLHPFAFGDAVVDGLETCWQRVVEQWRDPRISRWAGSLRSHRDIPASSVTPYLDPEVALGQTTSPAGQASSPRLRDDDRLPAKTPPPPQPGDVAEQAARARAEILTLAMGRRYRLGDVRIGGGPTEHYVRSAPSGRVVRLNATAAAVVQALDGGTPTEAVERLATRFAGTDRELIARDVLTAGHSLARREILVPALATTPSGSRSPGTPDLPEAVPGGA